MWTHLNKKKRFDPENMGFVKTDTFLKRLGLSVDGDENPNDQSINELFKSNDENLSGLNIPYASMPETTQVNKYKVRNASHKNANPIEKWLKKRFRDGFSKMKTSFEELDLHKTGQVRRDQFLNVLRQHGFKLENNLLDAFLERCDLHIPKNSTLISYVDFLEKFQNRSDQGLAYRVITGGYFLKFFE